MVIPGTVNSADMAQVSAFELTIKGEPLGLLPLSPIPIAGFTNEGGFKPPADFESWKDQPPK